ncbi:hypothetical protein C4K88_00210 [Arthrobacter pityocampae]|uniref:Uncharacterized protein n=1 Tax=Arthrobacter pityocampae TaxID=547334 RepID=A0A2S5J0R5_9MICC|nr:hypothetical protein [Arthrobacter pityocampae]PPB50381.1 hypothetical protein C4K88_00210 [Arthrobacter pityocampae]
MAQKSSFVHRFMSATSKLQMFFGPAAQGTTAGSVVYRNDAAQQGRQHELEQWQVVRNADGSTYLTTRTPE